MVTRSPLTECYIDTYIGGNIGHDLRKAGWDGLFITGASESWSVSKSTTPPPPSIPPMTSWGRRREVEQALEDLGECVSIGPAGENGIRIASPLTAAVRPAEVERGLVWVQAPQGVHREGQQEAASAMRYAEDFSMADAIKEQRKEMGRTQIRRSVLRLRYQPGPHLRCRNGRMPTANYSSTDAQIPDLSALVSVAAQAVKPLLPWPKAPPPSRCCRRWTPTNSRASTGTNPCPMPSNRAAVRRAPSLVRRPTDPPLTVEDAWPARPRNRVDRPEYETLAMLGANPASARASMSWTATTPPTVWASTRSPRRRPSLMCEVAQRGWMPEGWADHFHAPFVVLRRGRRCPVGVWHSRTAAARSASSRPRHAGRRILVWDATAGAAAASEHIEAVTGHPTTRLTVTARVSTCPHGTREASEATPWPT